MSKISNAIQMLNYLNTGNKYSVKELAEKLEITPRMVRYYKSELEQAGIPIETFMGPNGGYYLVHYGNQYLQFNKYDVELLEAVYQRLKNDQYIDIESYEKILEKIKRASDITEEKSKFFVIDKMEKESGLYETIREAIQTHSKLRILYRNLKLEWKERWIHPIQIFQYQDKFYVIAYCELRNDIRHFEFSRIQIPENQ